jgi:hypothetical protein
MTGSDGFQQPPLSASRPSLAITASDAGGAGVSECGRASAASARPDCSIHLPPSPEEAPMSDYLEDRVKPQRQWYETKASINKKLFVNYQRTIIILGALIPVIVACEMPFEFIKPYVGLVTSVIAAVIAVCAGLDKLNQPQTTWFNYRATEEAIKMEESFFLYRAGPYRDLSATDAQVLFVERVEGMISADIARFANLGKKAAPDKAEGDDDRGGEARRAAVSPRSGPAE